MKELKTIKDVLEECLKIWDELARTGEEYKPDTEYRNDCPCCEWVYQKYRCMKCEDCPLWELWGNQICEEDGSPYDNWNFHSFTANDRKIQAKLIADYCREQLEKMEG